MSLNISPHPSSVGGFNFMEQKQLFRIIDKRTTNFYWTDKEFLNGYAKMVGWQGQCVYHALCRHEKEGSCFPSLIHLAKELGVSKNSVVLGIKNLLAYKIIEVKRTKTKRGRGNNVYYLLPKEQWEAVNNWSNQGKEYKAFKGIKVKVS